MKKTFNFNNLLKISKKLEIAMRKDPTATVVKYKISRCCVEKNTQKKRISSLYKLPI